MKCTIVLSTATTTSARVKDAWKPLRCNVEGNIKLKHAARNKPLLTPLSLSNYFFFGRGGAEFTEDESSLVCFFPAVFKIIITSDFSVRCKGTPFSKQHTLSRVQPFWFSITKKYISVCERPWFTEGLKTKLLCLCWQSTCPSSMIRNQVVMRSIVCKTSYGGRKDEQSLDVGGLISQIYKGSGGGGSRMRNRLRNQGIWVS